MRSQKLVFIFTADALIEKMSGTPNPQKKKTCASKKSRKHMALKTQCKKKRNEKKKFQYVSVETHKCTKPTFFTIITVEEIKMFQIYEYGTNLRNCNDVDSMM